MLVDPFGRQITYLRVSVTDRCNLRCVYCMPAEGVEWKAHSNILRYEEITRIVRTAASLGIRSIRLTGGEPLVRKDLPDLVAQIAAIPGIEDIGLTTNGILLEKMAEPLAKAGLTRVNVSLDTLKPATFARLTRGGSSEAVWRGLMAAEANHLAPIKINTVGLRGINEDELVDLARLSLTRPWHIRFIELMPINNQAPWGPDFPPPDQLYLPLQEVKQRLAELNLQPMPVDVGSGPAQEFTIPGALGRVGFISPLGDKFCDRCNRLRLTADGHLRPCLVSATEISLAEALHKGDSLEQYILQAVAAKPQGHELSQFHDYDRCMMQIGG